MEGYSTDSASQNDEPGWQLPHRQHDKAGECQGKGVGVRDTARPDRIIKRGTEDADHGSVGAHHDGLRQRQAASRVPERHHSEKQEEARQEDRCQSDEGARKAVRIGRQNHAEISGKGESRARNGLGCAIPGEESISADPAGLHHFRFKQGQDDMATAKDERAGAIEGIK